MVRKLTAGAVAILASMAFFGAAFAQTETEKKDEWHSGAYDQARGTNFADPNGYKRMIPYQGAGGDGAAGGDGGAGAGAGAGAGSGSAGSSGGDGCGPR